MLERLGIKKEEKVRMDKGVQNVQNVQSVQLSQSASLERQTSPSVDNEANTIQWQLKPQFVTPCENKC